LLRRASVVELESRIAAPRVESMSIANTLLTAGEFSRMPDPGHPQELVRGVVVDMPPPRIRHGEVCVNIGYELKAYCRSKNLGRVFGNDAGIITERKPDTVRGADVGFVSYEKVPAGPAIDYLDVPPDALFEVLSPSNRRVDVHRKIAEYLQMGVAAVYVVDADLQRIQCYYLEHPEEILTTADELVGIGALAGWRVPVSRFFE
jgi:Uma2 family endonuclease